jgi:hypothetical protein
MKNQDQAPVRNLSIQIEQVNGSGEIERETMHLITGDKVTFYVSFEVPMAGYTMKLTKPITITVV